MFSGLDFLRNMLWRHQLCLQSVLLLKDPHASSVWQGRTAPTEFPASQRLVPTLVSQETGLGLGSLFLRAFRVKVS